MNKRALHLLVSLLIAGLFIWLAFRSVDLQELGRQIQSISFGWILPFTLTLLFSHYLRAERWRLLLKQEEQSARRPILFAGVMTGYFVNNFVPRLGEVTRPLYVAKKENLPSGTLFGTIILERLIDMASMLFITAIAAFTFSREIGLFEKLLGLDEWNRSFYLFIPVFLGLMVLVLRYGFRWIHHIHNKQKPHSPLTHKILTTLISFGDGIGSLRHVKNWPLFLLLTIGIWSGYILMAFFPFYMLDLGELYGLGLPEALILTLISSVGLAIPTPAGIGSYHLLIQQGLALIYQVPAETGLTYATVTHAATFLVVLLFTPIVLWWAKWFDMTHPKRIGEKSDSELPAS